MSLNLIFMGTPNFAVPILKAIQESHHNILEVYTQPPKKKTVDKKLTYQQYINFVMKLILE